MKQPLKILLISFVVIVFANITVFWFVIRPEKIAIKQKEADYFVLRENLLEVRQRIKNEKYIKESISNIKSDLDKFDLILPRHEEITRLIQELPNIAEKTGVKVSGVKYQPFVKDEGYNRLSFSLPVEGKYSNIRKFIYELETMRKIIWIERLAIRTSYSVREELTIQLTMSTYFL
ncbi:MAG: type 4a pilus biogenesis protein PilO [bacterium]|nr:type 4a pilus biogenesis protein PilO [bacterium]